jgi:hypothetical protein
MTTKILVIDLVSIELVAFGQARQPIPQFAYCFESLEASIALCLLFGAESELNHSRTHGADLYLVAGLELHLPHYRSG